MPTATYPFGAQRTTEGSALPTDYTFTGQKSDDSTGLMFYNARYYDTSLGRFTQPDTIVPNLLDSQSLNRYAYVLNNPLKYTDPTGHVECWDEDCNGGSGGGGGGGGNGGGGNVNPCNDDPTAEGCPGAQEAVPPAETGTKQSPDASCGRPCKDDEDNYLGDYPKPTPTPKTYLAQGRTPTYAASRLLGISTTFAESGDWECVGRVCVVSPPTNSDSMIYSLAAEEIEYVGQTYLRIEGETWSTSSWGALRRSVRINSLDGETFGPYSLGNAITTGHGSGSEFLQLKSITILSNGARSVTVGNGDVILTGVIPKSITIGVTNTTMGDWTNYTSRDFKLHTFFLEQSE